MASTSQNLAKNTNAPDVGDNHVAFCLPNAQGVTSVPQPFFKDEMVVKNWRYQMLIPFTVGEKLVAFHGPLFDSRTNPSKIQAFFPCYPQAIPLAFQRDVVLDLKFMNPKRRVFRSMPSLGNKEYLAWLSKV